MEERRQIPRWEIKKEAKVLMHGSSSNAGCCIIEDMHLKGMSVSFNEPLPQDRVKMSFTIGGVSGLIKTEAQVPWVKEDGGRYVYGLSFSKIDDEDKDRIYKYISSNCYDQIRNKWWEGVR